MIEKENEEPTATPQRASAIKLYNLANDLQAQERLPEAIGLYAAAIFLDPNYAKAYINRGIAKTSIGNYEGAIADFHKATRCYLDIPVSCPPG